MSTLFCCKYRIYKNILRLVYFDVARFYRVCYACVTEAIHKFETLPIDEAKKICSMCACFITLTEEAQGCLGGVLSQMKESTPCIITYFKVWFALTKNNSQVLTC